jgi:hypothetical protein
MPRGGARNGAGRPRRALAEAAKELGAASGELSPLDFLLRLVNDETAPPALRLKAAGLAAPFIHPRTPIMPTSYRYISRKRQREIDAETAGVGTDWGTDLLYEQAARPATDAKPVDWGDDLRWEEPAGNG